MDVLAVDQGPPVGMSDTDCSIDGLVFKGHECDHWRDAYNGISASMAFLHYVDQDGPYREWRYDKRADLHRAELEARNED